MDDRAPHVLLIEKDADDARWIAENLSEGTNVSWQSPTFAVTHVERWGQGLNHLEAASNGDAPSIDGILINPRFPESQPGEVLQTLHAEYPHIPMVVLVSRGGETMSEALIPAGVRAILYKDEIQGSLLAHTMMHAIERHTDAQALTEREAVLKAQRESEARYRALVETSPESIVLTDLEGRILFCNPQTAAMYGTPEVEDLIGENVFSLIVPEHHERAQTYAAQVLQGQKIQAVEYKVNRMDGSQFFAKVSASLIKDDEGNAQAFIGVTRDVSARKQVELERQAALAALQESQARFRLIYEKSPVGIAMTADDYHFIEANPAFCEFLGYTETEIQDLTIFDICHSEDRESSRQAMEIAKNRSRDWTFDMERRYVRKDGAVVWGHTALARVCNAEGTSSFWLSLTQDITEHRRLELQREAARTSLRESEERFRLAMEATQDGLWDWKVETGEVYYSPAYATMLGYEPETFPATVGSWIEHLHPEDREAAIIANQECIQNLRDAFEIEFRMRTRTGEWRWILGRGKAVARDQSGRATRVVGTHTDITERKRAEAQRETAFEALQESQRLLEDLSKRLMQTHEMERRALARKLHEEIAQIVIAVKINLQSLSGEGLGEGTGDALRTSMGALDDAVALMRHLSRALRPAVLDDLGLVPALRALVDRQAHQASLRVSFSACRLDDRLPSILEDAYYRIAQEAVTNVTHHAQATHLSVELRREDGQLVLIVRDDGVGFNADRIRRKADPEESLGLLSMHERAYVVGGTLDVSSEPGRGTEVRVRTPLPTDSPPT